MEIAVVGSSMWKLSHLFPGGAADKNGTLKVGDEIISVNSTDCTRMSRIEAWNFMKKLSDGTANLVVRHKIEQQSQNAPQESSKVASKPKKEPAATTEPQHETTKLEAKR